MRQLSAVIESPFDFSDPLAPLEEPDEPSDLEGDFLPRDDEARWDAFLADDDERDPLPEPGDFWPEYPND